ncbi:MAG: methylated-DNA--[protein]-cysteine S-methyltransferase [Verrucomicrobiota bacterium]
MTYFSNSFPTPAGDFSVVVNEAGAVVAAVFGDQAALPVLPAHFELRSDGEKTAEARAQLLAYFAGERNEFDLSLAPEGTPFQHRVWAALREIPFGETRSYGDLAELLGSSPRAVGRANATNPICVFVPCHRVNGADGSLTGYAGGLDQKRWLLEHEGVLAACLL